MHGFVLEPRAMYGGKGFAKVTAVALQSARPLAHEDSQNLTKALWDPTLTRSLSSRQLQRQTRWLLSSGWENTTGQIFWMQTYLVQLSGDFRLALATPCASL